MGAGLFFARWLRKVGFPMGGDSGGAAVREQTQTGAQGAAEP